MAEQTGRRPGNSFAPLLQTGNLLLGDGFPGGGQIWRSVALRQARAERGYSNSTRRHPPRSGFKVHFTIARDGLHFGGATPTRGRRASRHDKKLWQLENRFALQFARPTPRMQYRWIYWFDLLVISMVKERYVVCAGADVQRLARAIFFYTVPGWIRSNSMGHGDLSPLFSRRILTHRRGRCGYRGRKRESRSAAARAWHRSCKMWKRPGGCRRRAVVKARSRHDGHAIFSTSGGQRPNRPQSKRRNVGHDVVRPGGLHAFKSGLPEDGQHAVALTR